MASISFLVFSSSSPLCSNSRLNFYHFFLKLEVFSSQRGYNILCIILYVIYICVYIHLSIYVYTHTHPLINLKECASFKLLSVSDTIINFKESLATLLLVL